MHLLPRRCGTAAPSDQHDRSTAPAALSGSGEGPWAACAAAGLALVMAAVVGTAWWGKSTADAAQLVVEREGGVAASYSEARDALVQGDLLRQDAQGTTGPHAADQARAVEDRRVHGALGLIRTAAGRDGRDDATGRPAADLIAAHAEYHDAAAVAPGANRAQVLLADERTDDALEHLQTMLEAGERQHELAAEEAADTVSTTQRSAAALTAVVSVLALALLLLFTRMLQRSRSALAVSAEKMRRAALTDELTGLGNRSLMALELSAALDRRRDDDEVALVLIDLDRFKEINDTLGHHYGDRLLQLVGPRLTPGLRPEDVVARLGGDEFAVLLPGVTGPQQAEEVALRLHGSLLDAFDVDGVALSIEASMGIAVSGFHGADATILLQRADMAMYAAKRRIGGVRLFEPDMDTHSPERLQLLGELRLALQRRELVLHFQPKVSLPSGRCVGFEALVRWQHPTRGMVPPDTFISLAEGTGLIEPLTRYVLDLALRQCAEWRAAGHDDLPVAVNVSARNLLESDLVEVVRDLLRTHDVPASCLVLEVTESAVMADPDKATEVLTRLHALGVAVALDDFGAGYTSLAQLRTLPLHELKIDRQFVTEMATRSDDEMIVRSIVELGHNLGLKLVAEGVEDAASAERLMLSGCESAQGYHFARPIPSAALPAWLAEQREVHRPVALAT
jgi:diguanylate cyclase (GGDEF)-like protein